MHESPTYRPEELTALTAVLAVAAIALGVRSFAASRPAPRPRPRLEVVRRGPLDLNAASLDALTALPGVGRGRAALLLACRPLGCWHDVERALGRDRAQRLRSSATVLPERHTPGVCAEVRGPPAPALRGPRSSPGAGG